jgi:hypothetical protein
VHRTECRSATTGAPLSAEALPFLDATRRGYIQRCGTCRPDIRATSAFAQAIIRHEFERGRKQEAAREAERLREEQRRAERHAEKERDREHAAALVGHVRLRDIERIRSASVDDLAVLAIFEDVVDLMATLTENEAPVDWEPGEAEVLIRGGCILTDFQAGLDAAVKAGAYRRGPVWGYVRNTALRRRVQLLADRRDDR